MTFSKVICATMVASASAGVRGQGPPAAPAVGKWWPKYSWNSTNQSRNCECHEVEWEGAFDTKQSCLTAYSSEEGIHGDFCGRPYDAIAEEDFKKVELQKEDAAICEGVKDEGLDPIYPVQSGNCLDLMSFFDGEIEAKDVLVHRGTGKVLDCLAYGLDTPLCQPHLGCNALEYTVPVASGFKSTMGVQKAFQLPKEASTCDELVEFINKEGGFKTLALKDIQVVQRNKTKTNCEQYGGSKPLCGDYCRHLEYELEEDINADSSVVAMGVMVPLFAFLF